MSEPFIGQITMFGGNFAPRNWENCDGQLLSIAQNSALFSLLGTTYGGDGRTTFGLPDLRGRVAIGEGQGAGLPDYRLGQKGGSETTTLLTQNLPAHSHAVTGTLRATEEDATSDEAIEHVLAGVAGATLYDSGPPAEDMAAGGVTGTTANTGVSQSINNMQPFQVIRFIIALQGIFPSRN